MVKPYNGNAHYNGNALLKTGSNWLACIGRRSNGKSYWWLQFCIIDCLENGHQCAYVRRNEKEIRKKTVDVYFQDDALCKWLKKNYDFDGIIYDAGELFFYKADEHGKPANRLKFGNAFAVAVARQYKSLHYDKIYNVMYEEFITDEGYLDDEWNKFNSILSTVFRLRKGRVILIGNTISRACPYFVEMGFDIKKLKQGEITTIKHTQADGNHVALSVEYTKDIDAKNGMFFGRVEKVINSGVWETEEYPHLFFDLDEAEILYKFFYIEGDFCFRLQIVVYDDHKYIYAYPYEADRLEFNTRDDIFFQSFTTRDNVYNMPSKKRHARIWEIFERGKVLYSDNLCGTELNDCLKRFNPFL